MAGFTRQVSHSLQRRLSVTLGVVILITALFSAGLTFYLALDEAHELQDDTLSQIAHLVKYTPDQPGELNKAVQKMEGDNDASISIAFLSPQGAPLTGASLPFPLTMPLSEGFQDATGANHRYRVRIHRLSADTVVVIAQRVDVRDEIAFDSALRTLIPLTLLLPVLLLIATDLIRKSLRPVRRLADEVNQRDEHDLTPLTHRHVPDEIRPFVIGINKLLQKVDNALRAQKRFVADAAHELRSPLTALTLQAERLAAAEMSAEARDRLASLRKGLNRTRTLLEQLLTLAREQQRPQAETAEPVQINDLFREVIEALLPLAVEKAIDIGVVPQQPAPLPLVTEKQTLQTAIKNLVENAIRYTPQDGQIDLSARQLDGQFIIEIEDNGPGIPDEERERVFDPFYRPAGMVQPGSGLGLSIVSACVARLGGQIALHPASHFPTGLLARIMLPTAGK